MAGANSVESSCRSFGVVALAKEMTMYGIPSPSEIAGYLGFAIIPTFVALGYLFFLLDRRDERPSKSDNQIGSKLVLWGFILAGISLVLGGANSLVSFILGGFKGGFDTIKGALATIVSGGVVAMAFAVLFLPRTNNSLESQSERYAMGVLAMSSGLAAVIAFSGFIRALFFGDGWSTLSDFVSMLSVYGTAAGFALLRHGTLSGWTATPSRPMPMAPPGGYGGQQGGGYPPQGGYPPAGGGYPPQGGGYGGPPGGYPPQGGGYGGPPGGGFPPTGR